MHTDYVINEGSLLYIWLLYSCLLLYIWLEIQEAVLISTALLLSLKRKVAAETGDHRLPLAATFADGLESIAWDENSNETPLHTHENG